MRRLAGPLACLAAALLLLTAAGAAQAQNNGFQINRFEPTAAGEATLWVDHPWYSRTRYFAGGLTLNYGRQPLVFGYIGPGGEFNPSTRAIAQQLVGHLDLAGSFLDRVLVTLSLPVTLAEAGEPGGGVAPVDGLALGDPRLGVLLRVYGQPYESKFSLSLGGLLWLPLRGLVGSVPPTQSDLETRGLPKVVLGGLASRLLWSTSLGFLIRPEAAIGNQANPAGRTAGSELQVGVALAYANKELRLSVGPELVFASALSGNAFQLSYSSLEALLGLHYNIARLVQVSLGGGVGVLRQPGTPESRFLLRIAYAPLPAPPPGDRDRDGVPDLQDFCPDEQKGAHPDSAQLGCPLRDRDGDGVFDDQDQCLDGAAGAHPDPARPGCPQADRDRDGVPDHDDLCADEPRGEHPDLQQPGCPQRDRDHDGVLDPSDQCPDKARGERPDPARPGCPAGDRDADGLYDPEDQCPDEPRGGRPDPTRPGCPLADRDHDTVPDAADACPEQAGAPSPASQKNGCPGLVEVKGAALGLAQPVDFASRKDKLTKKSFPVLQAVADALIASPQLKKVRIEVHAEDRGQPDRDRELAERRAQSVLTWLLAHGVAPARLEAQGLAAAPPPGETQPPPGGRPHGRGAGRPHGHGVGRLQASLIDFVIVDPSAAAEPLVKPADTVEPAPAGEPALAAKPVAANQPDQPGAPTAKPGKPDQTDKPGKRPHHRRRKSP